MKIQTLLILVFVSGLAVAATPGQRVRPIETSNPEYPESAKSQGHQGKVFVSLLVLSSGLPDSVAVKESSHSQILDEAAVASVLKWKFSPATDSQGNPISSRVVVPIEFAKDSVATVMKKACGDLNADVQFFKTAFPDKPLSHMRISVLTLGMLTLSGKSPNIMPALGDAFPRAFESAVRKCEANPDDTYGNVLASSIKELNL